MSNQSTTNWVSRGFEELVAAEAAGTTQTYDVVIVGSGYGGAIAADTFSRSQAGGQPVKVCVLERGREYLPGAFANGFRELPKHVRMDRNKEGLFDIRGGSDVNTVVANGLGGGSLINAGVMEKPSDSVFDTGWPAQISAAGLSGYYDDARTVLGAQNDIASLPSAEIPLKYEHIRDQATSNGLPFRPAAITVAMSDSASSGNVRLNKCVRCGDCATGCNFGAKDSLDVNLLYRAFRQGAEIYTGATVLDFQRDTGANLWIVNAVHTDAVLRKREGSRTTIKTRKLILAAGALGSTELLMRSQTTSLSFSSMLGYRCSTNGDMLVADYDSDSVVNTVADESNAPYGRGIGPTITGLVDLRATEGIVIEEMSVPAGLHRAFAEIFGTVNALHMLDVKDETNHVPGYPDDDIYEVRSEHVENSSLYAVMGNDGANGSIDLFVDGKRKPADQLTDRDDGVGRIEWQDVQHLPLFDKQVEQVAALCAGSGGKILPNPVWKLLPAKLNWLLEGRRGPVTTVHPLGGCAMGDNIDAGVVDHMGRVFDPATAGGEYHGLVVLDGSIVPTALGINPALTITAVSLRAAGLLANHWGYNVANPVTVGQTAVRPTLRDTNVPFNPTPTTVEIFERLTGPVKFDVVGGRRKTRVVELTLRFDEHDIATLTRPSEHDGGATLKVSTDTSDPTTTSRIRIYEEDVWNELRVKHIPPQRLEETLDQACIFNAPVTGTLNVFQRAESKMPSRMLRAAGAYMVNRGLRDWNQSSGDGGPSLGERIKSGKALASRSGEIRLFEYALDIGPPVTSQITLDGTRIVGRKEFTYALKCNPWRQLMEVSFSEFPGIGSMTKKRIVKLDPVYLTRIGVPLFQLARQQDGATAIADLIAFFGYFIRLLVGVHIWSFRHPDAETGTKTIDRFPSKAGNMPDPVAYPLNLPPERPAGGDAPVAGRMQLTRFVGTDASKNPVMLIPGYSTSGTAFAHHAVNPNFASHLWKNGRDVWILDMRTSSAFPLTASEPWSFEQMAYRDIPLALHTIYSTTGKQVDVHAHCMGAAMLSMAILHSDSMPTPVPGFPNVKPEEMQQWLRRISFSQVGPLVVMSPANIFRGYALRYFLQYLPDDYQFRPEDPTFADDLLDRILYTLPYPEEEFRITNPIAWWKRTEWTRTRHRMDALYGRSFNLVNMDDDVLKHIDDQFGPMSIRTVTQAIHFSRYSMITDVRGRNTFVSRDYLDERWRTEPTHKKIQTFSVHGSENGLADVRTLDRIDAIMKDAGLPYAMHTIDNNRGVGHQDALIGDPKEQTFKAVLEFLDADLPDDDASPSSEQVAYPPWIGPIVTQEYLPADPENPPSLNNPLRDRTTIRIGTRPTHRKPECAVLLPVEVNNGRLTRPNNEKFEDDDASRQYIVTHLVTYVSPRLQDEHWDAFLRPEFPGINGYAGPVVVLVIYNATEQLGSLGLGGDEFIYLGIDTSDDDNWVFVPIDPSPDPAPDPAGPTRVRPGLPADPDDRKFPRNLVATVLRELASQWPAPTTSPPSDPEETPPPVLMQGTLDETESAVLDRLRDEDYDLNDGVFTHQAPDPVLSSPDPAGTAFVLGSCQFPRGFLDRPIAYAGYSHLLDRLRGISVLPVPKFALLCGDQVYVDPTAGLFDPTVEDDRYELPYHTWLRNMQVRGVLRLLPSFMLLDDHEIEDNWEPTAPALNSANDKLRNDGVDAFHQYQHGIEAPASNGNQSTEFMMEGIPIMQLDTRSNRSRRTAGSLAAAQLFDASTLTTLTNFVSSNPTIPKFVVSPSMLLPRHRRAVGSDASAIRSDGWDGYRRTFHQVLKHIVDDPNVQHVVFLSGDEHCGAVATIDLKNQSTGANKRIHSIHTPGLYTPYPFANAAPHDLLGDETFTFQSGGTTYECKVATSYPATRNRFTYLNLKQDRANWILEYQFGDGPLAALVI